MVHIEYLNNCEKEARKHRKEDSEGIAVFLPNKEYQMLDKLLPNFEEQSNDLTKEERKFVENIHYYILDLELRADKL